MLPRLPGRMMALTYLSLGSNLGDREIYLKQALERLAEHDVTLLRTSSLYETSPQDVSDQPWFLNQVAECRTNLSPALLLRQLHRVELAGGRVRKGAMRRGPRVIDLDILLYEQLVLSTSRLVIPHPRLLGRRFVLQPLTELNPNLIHPVTGRLLRSYLPEVADQPLRRFSPR